MLLHSSIRPKTQKSTLLCVVAQGEAHSHLPSDHHAWKILISVGVWNKTENFSYRLNFSM